MWTHVTLEMVQRVLRVPPVDVWEHPPSRWHAPCTVATAHPPGGSHLLGRAALPVTAPSSARTACPPTLIVQGRRRDRGTRCGGALRLHHQHE
jgi:hypothetical protein